jgi:cell division septum initiation protein DivIVA
VNKVVPDIGNLIETVKQDLEQLQDKGKDVGNQIEELKKKVVQARDLANR